MGCPNRFPNFFTRHGGMNLLMSFVSASSTLLNGSGDNEVLGDVFAGVTKMLSGKKFLYNVRALRMLVEEVLRSTICFEKQIITCMVIFKHSSTSWASVAEQTSCGLTVSSALSSLFWNTCVQGVRETGTFTYDVLRRWFHIYLLVDMCTTLAMPCTIFAHLSSSLLMSGGSSKMEHMSSTTIPESGTEFGHIWQIETTNIRYGNGDGGGTGVTLNDECIKTWAYGIHICSTILQDLDEMRDIDPAPSQLHHKEEGKGRITSDGMDRLSLQEKLELCIDPLDPEQHQQDGKYCHWRSGISSISECWSSIGEAAVDAFRAHLFIYLRKLVIWLHAIDLDPLNLELWLDACDRFHLLHYPH